MPDDLSTPHPDDLPVIEHGYHCHDCRGWVAAERENLPDCPDGRQMWHCTQCGSLILCDECGGVAHWY